MKHKVIDTLKPNFSLAKFYNKKYSKFTEERFQFYLLLGEKNSSEIINLNIAHDLPCGIFKCFKIGYQESAYFKSLWRKNLAFQSCLL